MADRRDLIDALRQTYDAVEPPAELERRLQDTLQPYTNPPAARHARLPRRWVAVLVAILVLTLTACAVVLTQSLMSRWKQESDEIYTAYHQVLDTEQTVNGWTLRLTACIGDHYSVILGVELTPTDQADGLASIQSDPMTYNRIGLYAHLEADGQPIGGSGALQSLNAPDDWDETVTLPIVGFVELDWGNVYADNPQTVGYEHYRGQQITVVFEGLQYYDQDGTESFWVDLQPDGWRIPVCFDYEDATRTYPVNQTVPFVDGELTLAEVQVSPLSLTYHLEGPYLDTFYDTVDSLRDDGESTEESGRYLFRALQAQLRLLDADGNDLALITNASEHQMTTVQGSWIDDTDGSLYQYVKYTRAAQDADGSSAVLNMLAEPDRVAYLEFNGVKVALQ